MHLCAFIPIFVPKLVAMVTPFVPSVRECHVANSAIEQILSQNQTAWISCIQLKLWPFLWYFCLFWPKFVAMATSLTHTHAHTHTHTTVLQPFFQDHSGETVPEENFWTLWCKGRLTVSDTLTIQLGATPSGLTSAYLRHPPYFFTGRMPFLPPNQQC